MRPSWNQTVSTSPSRYFESSQASRLLPMPAGPITLTRRARWSRPVAWNRSLSWRSSSSRPTNGASSVSARLRPPTSATTRIARQASTGAALPLSCCSPAFSKAIALLRSALGRLPDEDGARLGDRLQSRGRVHEVAGDHALVGRAQGHGRLAGQDPGSGGNRRSEGTDGIDQLEGRSHGAFGVILVRRWCTPDGHDRVTDELLDRAAVAADHLLGELEVAGQELAGVLGILALGQGREADQVGEQDRHEPALGGRGLGRVANRGLPELRQRQWLRTRSPAGSVAPRTRRRTWRLADSRCRRTGQPLQGGRRTRRRTCVRRRWPCRSSNRSSGLFSHARSVAHCSPIGTTAQLAPARTATLGAGSRNG